MTPEFTSFQKIARLNRQVIITEKIDGTNAQIHIVQSLAPEAGALAHKSLGDAGDLSLYAGSRNRYLTPDNDNFGFAKWALAHAEELFTLGPGKHFGEWWGNGIQRTYGLAEKRFSLFNTTRWCLHGVEPVVLSNPDPRLSKYQDVLPPCVGLVPELYVGPFNTNDVNAELIELRQNGSVAAPGFMKPEGIVVFHTAGGSLFKVTLEGDESPKGRS